MAHLAADVPQLGKPVGGDLSNGVLTLPSLLLLERSPNDNPIRELFERRNADGALQQVLDLLHSSAIIEESFAIAAEFRDKAIRSLNGLPLTEPRRTLEELADYTLQRRS